MRRLQRSEAQPFTYGHEQLNPDFMLRSRSQLSTDDDVPLAQLPRVRRDSEGELEVRPMSMAERMRLANEDQLLHAGAPPWLDEDAQQRYNVYDPHDEDEESSVSSLDSM